MSQWAQKRRAYRLNETEFLEEDIGSDSMEVRHWSTLGEFERERLLSHKFERKKCFEHEEQLHKRSQRSVDPIVGQKFTSMLGS